MSKPTTDVIRRVFEPTGARFIEVGPWPDSPDLVELRTIEGEFSAGYWGPINLTITPDMAAELGRALLALADELSAAS